MFKSVVHMFDQSSGDYGMIIYYDISFLGISVADLGDQNMEKCNTTKSIEDGSESFQYKKLRMLNHAVSSKQSSK